MPTYEYECTKCGAVTDVFQPITEPARRRLKKSDKPTCACGAEVIRRIGIGGGILFRGSGFYETDYRSESYKKAAKAEKDAVSGKTKPDDGKAEKKTKSGSEKSSGAEKVAKPSTAA